MSNFVDTEKILVSTHLYTVSTGFLLLFTEFLREIGAATFKIYAYMPGFGSLWTNEWAEKRFSEIIMEFSERDMSSFREIVFPKIFTCPLCGAQYSLRVLKKIEDGLFECQNCGKKVHFQEPETDDTKKPPNEYSTP
jgi:predicted RNA-binding Zn-ribbon protein involved in translation (DUF1610 family)